jgi:hypothetical protein
MEEAAFQGFGGLCFPKPFSFARAEQGTESGLEREIEPVFFAAGLWEKTKRDGTIEIPLSTSENDKHG